MGLSLTQRAQDLQPIEPRERLERLTGFTASQLAAGMTWLAGYDPRTFDAVLDAVEPGTGQDGSDDPEPFCADPVATLAMGWHGQLVASPEHGEFHSYPGEREPDAWLVEVVGYLDGIGIWLVSPERIDGHFVFRQHPDSTWQVVPHLREEFHLSLPVHTPFSGNPVA